MVFRPTERVLNHSYMVYRTVLNVNMPHVSAIEITSDHLQIDVMTKYLF